MPTVHIITACFYLNNLAIHTSFSICSGTGPPLGIADRSLLDVLDLLGIADKPSPRSAPQGRSKLRAPSMPPSWPDLGSLAPHTISVQFFMDMNVPYVLDA